MGEETLHRLATTLAKLRQKIQQIRDRKEPIGEENTKAALVDPLLAALGWNVEEIDEVCREYRRKARDNPVDYALFLLRSPCLFVEAKPLDRNLDDRKWITQTVNYANVVGVEWCVLTNGDEYRLYNAHAPVDVEEKLFRSIRISQSGQDQCIVDTLALLSKEEMAENSINVHWKSHFVDRKVKAAVDDLFRNEDRGLLRLLGSKATGLRPADIRSSLQRAIIKVEFPLISAPTARRDVKQPERAKGMGKGSSGRQPAKFEATLVDLIRAGLVHPPVALERQYKGVRLQATVEQDGMIVFDGKRYDSLSTAGGMARKSVVGAPSGKPYPQTNGWTFWKYRDAGSGKLTDLDSLRHKYLRSRTS
ncbi:MAG: type I restriction enzyme HsdR N-terminal domain-containing protein [Acidobacteria bacterium]|nr:type I restriction enzyme HsdR N-terminal domain-containing protein [Acidobacteriota bacterium]